MSREEGSKRILAIASGGGHWMQLRRLRPAFEGHDLALATVHENYRVDAQGARFYTVTDATRWDRWRLIKLALEVLLLVLRERPDVVVSTGAAPGLFGLLFGKLFGARTVWIDSIANVEALSMSGEKAGRLADLWLTQWPHLARPGGPRHLGSVL